MLRQYKQKHNYGVIWVCSLLYMAVLRHYNALLELMEKKLE